MISPFGFDPQEDYFNSESTLPNIKQCEDYEDKESYRLDEWDWDETLAEEKSDIIRKVNRRCNLITLLGGRTAAVIQLHKSILKNELQLAKCLLKRDDLDMNLLIDPLGRNMLHIAASCGNNFAVALAIRSGMDINKTTVYGATPLMLSCAWGKEITCDLLLDLNADPTIRDRHGRTALSLASNGLRIHLLKHAKMKLFFKKQSNFENDNENNSHHGTTSPHNIIKGFKKNSNNMNSQIDENSIIGDDMDDQWRFSIQDGFLDQIDMFSKGHRVSENYNICLYNTVSNNQKTNDAKKK